MFRIRRNLFLKGFYQFPQVFEYFREQSYITYRIWLNNMRDTKIFYLIFSSDFFRSDHIIFAHVTSFDLYKNDWRILLGLRIVRHRTCKKDYRILLLRTGHCDTRSSQHNPLYLRRMQIRCSFAIFYLIWSSWLFGSKLSNYLGEGVNLCFRAFLLEQIWIDDSQGSSNSDGSTRRSWSKADRTKSS